MKKIFSAVILCALTQIIFSQIPAYQWAYSIGDVNQEYLSTLAIDAENNIIIAGDFGGSTDMNPTEFIKTLTSHGGTDAYIEKFDEDGNVSWGINFGGTGYESIVKILTDAESNIYAIGYFHGTADLNPDMVDESNVTSHGGYDMFLVKFNKEGEFIWGQGFGALQDDWINNMALDNAGNIYLTGQFIGTVDFDGSAGVLEINSTLDKYDGFLAKFNTDGEVSWVFRIGGLYDDIANEVAVDKDGNVIVTGTFQATADFYGAFLDAADGTMLGWPNEGDAYIAKYSSAGDLIWAKSIFGDTGFNGGYSNSVIALALDHNDNIYVTGLIYGEGDFDMNAGENIITSYSDYDSYFAKYDKDGNLAWAHTTAPKVIGYNLDMVIDANDDIYLTGDFNYSTGVPYEADFDVKDDNIFALQSKGEKDIYIAKYDTEANLSWAFNMGGTGWEFGTAIAIDQQFNVCAGGWFYNSDDFDANPDSNFIWMPYTIPTYGNNVWLGKYHQDGLVPVLNVENTAAFKLFPNPASSEITVELPGENAAGEEIIIYDITGKAIFTGSFKNSSATIDIAWMQKGMYFIAAGNALQKFIKQ